MPACAALGTKSPYPHSNWERCPGFASPSPLGKNPRPRNTSPWSKGLEFDFSDELKQLRDTATAFLAQHSPPAAARTIIDGHHTHDDTLWAQMAEMGWLAATVPETYGGLGLGHLAACVLAEEIGKAIAPVPYASTVYLTVEALRLFGNEEQKRHYLPKLVSGESIGTLAFAEGTGPNTPVNLRTRAGMTGISGRKAPVADGTIADLLVVAVAAHQSEPSLYLVESKQAGLTRETVATIDPSKDHAAIVLDSVRCAPLPGSNGHSALQALFDRAAVMMAFEQLGVAQAALDMACNHARERYAFGRPIGSFQAIKHKLVDVYVAVELARSNAYYGAWALEHDAADLPVAAAGARISATDAGWIATKENIQTHGGMGFTWDLDCHLYYRRAKLLGLALGGNAEWKRRLITQVASNAPSEAWA